MSNKTLNKRIALVAVTALTAGLFSVVAPSAANAGYGTNVAAATGTNPALAVADTLYIASAPSVTGSAVAIGASTTALADSPATSAAKSLGLVNVSDLAGGVTAGTTSTAVILNTGALSVYTSTLSAKYASIVVTGGTIASSTGDALNGAATVATAGAQSTVSNWGVTVKPNSGVSSVTIQLYSGYAYATSDDASNTAVQANPTGATGLSLQGQLTVSVTSASTAGTLSSAYSSVYGASGATDQSNTADDAAYLGSAAFNTAMYLNIRVRDGFANGLTSTTGLLQVSATNGALVKLNASNASSAGTTTSDYATGAAPDNYMVRVDAPSNAPVLTTVTATYNGTVIGSKTMLFSGKVTKIELYGAAIGSTSTATSNYAYYKLSDAAGNSTYTTVAGSSVSAYPYSTLSANAAAITGAATLVTKSREFSLGSNYSTVTSGRVYFSCTSTAGKGKIGLTYANLDGSIVNSNVLDVTCAGDPVTYKASWDKASYTPGDLATLTITAYDSKGNVANDVGTVTDSADATKIPVVAIGGLDKTITGPTTGDALDQGVVKYKYTVGATEGSYSGKVSFPTIDARYVSNVSAAGSDPVTVTLTVKNSTASVSNADVLKSIVALIASINKQIQALQKLILKR